MNIFQVFGIIGVILFLSQNNIVFGELEFNQMFGTKGNGDTNFDSPSGIALDSTGKIYVSDFMNSRISVWDSSGNFDSTILVNGQPHGIEIKEDKLYVAVWIPPHIEILETDGTEILSIPHYGRPGDVAINSRGEMYVTSYLDGRVQIYDSSGNILKIISDFPGQHTGITLDDLENIYVVDYINNRVIKLDPFGNYLFDFKVPDEYGGNFKNPTNVEINSEKNIFVTDNSGRIIVFDTQGNFIYIFGELGTDPEQLNGAHGITFDNSGHVYVSEMNNHRIQIFTTSDSLTMDSKMNDELMVVIMDSSIMGGTQIELEFSELHVNYDLTATQNGEVVFEETGLHSMEVIATHQIDAVGSDENPIDVQVVSLGIGAPGNEDNWTGPVGQVTTAQVVPEFGTIAMMVLAVAIISIVAVTAKSRVVPRF